jgi:SAM-dependent methyltransferase
VFDHSADLYDAIYDAVGKDYRAETIAVLDRVRAVRGSDPRTLLDVACGTGRHLEYFSAAARCAGLDLEPELLAIATRRCPEVRFVRGDMTNFDLGETFDAITCLFSSIGYARTKPRLRGAIGAMARHLGPGGVLIVEPWFQPDGFRDGVVQVIETHLGETRVVRMMRSWREGDLSVLEAHYLVGRSTGITHFTERHELGLFSLADYVDAFEAAGLHTQTEETGLIGRGLVVGCRSD